MKNAEKPKKVYADFSDAFEHFLISNVKVATFGEIGKDELPYKRCEIVIKLNERGGGIIHLLGEDSDTVDFFSMDHYKLTGTPKPKYLI